MQKYIICDLDGTLCDNGHRVHLAESRQWDRFHDGIPEDQPCHVVRELLLKYYGEYGIVLLTGRPERYRELTQLWLRKHMVPWGRLLMRKNEDWRHDYEIKLEAAQEAGLNPQNVIFALEDRDRMTEAWRAAGFTCFQVAKGTY